MNAIIFDQNHKINHEKVAEIKSKIKSEKSLVKKVALYLKLSALSRYAIYSKNNY